MVYAEKSEKLSPSRTSYRDESADISELDPLHSGSRIDRDAGGSFSRGVGAYPRALAHNASLTRLGTSLRPSRLCLFILIAVGLIILSLGRTRSPQSPTSSHIPWGYGSLPPDGQSPPYYPTPQGGQSPAWKDAYIKAANMVRQMSLVEKVNITTGTGWRMGMCLGNTGSVANVRFPSLCLQDGPLGIRFADNVTAFPAGISVGATWDKELMYFRGKAIGVEARTKGVNVLLGPAAGPMGRLPAGGRNWESFGADPVLQGVGASETIYGIQEEGVIATVKHYIGNEQEHFRQALEWDTANAISSQIDDRTLHELYLWPFAESIRAGVGAVMCSYNMINNSHACQNSKLLNGILKDELLFQGFVVSDWAGQRSGVASALAGLDMSMPGDGLVMGDGQPLWGPELTKAALNGSVPMERIDDMVLRIVATWFKLKQDDMLRWPVLEGGPNFSSWTYSREGELHPGSSDKRTGVVNKFIDAQGKDNAFHGNMAREIAAEGMVLVKNKGNVLPLNPGGSKSYEKRGAKRKRMPASQFRVAIVGNDAMGNPEGANACLDRACNVGTLTMGWGSGTAELPYLITPFDAIYNAYNAEGVKVSKVPTNKLSAEDIAHLQDQELCIVFASANSGEGYVSADGVRGDRNDLKLQDGGDELIKNVATHCGKGHQPTVVVVHSVGPVIVEPWIDLPGVSAVIFAGLPGQESGNAIQHVLFGQVNPCGHLPYTIGKKEEDYGPTSKVMYEANEVVPQQNFSEGLYFDYRYFDKHDIEPRFEFGYGLSYSTFTLADLKIEVIMDGKTSLPRTPDSLLEPPRLGSKIPDPELAVVPSGFKKVAKFIYPWLDSKRSAGPKGQYPLPTGYNFLQPKPVAGGAEGGNPNLFTAVATVEAELSNTGNFDGRAVVQLYISFPEDFRDDFTGEPIDFPVKVLRAFEKIPILKGEKQIVKFRLTRKDLSYWCVKRQNWVMPTTGKFKVSVGFSSRDLPLVDYF